MKKIKKKNNEEEVMKFFENVLGKVFMGVSYVAGIIFLSAALFVIYNVFHMIKLY